MSSGESKGNKRQVRKIRSGRPGPSRTDGENTETAVTDEYQGLHRQTGVRPQLFTFRAIGRVESAKGGDIPTDTIQDASLIVLLPELAGGLDGIVPGDRLMVIFVFDRAEKFELHQHPRGDPHRARRGVFDLRSPRRPNPIGVTRVDVLEIVDNVVRVRGLDAWPGTPVLDLKPEVKKEK
jgi:tRNA-Thr(GGU) m(6)t(6)A37 methyltransferase TsaA